VKCRNTEYKVEKTVGWVVKVPDRGITK